MNNYLLESDNKIFIKEKINELINNGFIDASISKYEVEEDFLDKVLEDLDTYSLFSSKKIIIVNDIDKLTTTDIDLYKNKIKLLYKYLDNPNNDNLLIFTVSKLLSNTFHKKLKEKTNYIKIESDIKNIIKDNLKGYKISNNDLEYLLELCDNDTYKIINEIEKLKQFCFDKKVITKDDIDLLVIKKIKETKFLAFDFTRSLLEKDCKKALKEYNKLLEEGNDTIKIIGLIASQLRTTLTIKVMEDDGYRRSDIAEKLNKKEFYIQKQQELTRLYSIKDIIKCIKDLQEIDMKSKSTDLDNKVLLDMYIINLK